MSNKTISKWENGKCMPDYSIIEQVCRELSVTLPELMDGYFPYPFIHLSKMYCTPEKTVFPTRSHLDRSDEIC